VIDLFGDKITEIFDFLFLDDEDSVIILEDGKGIVKMNLAAREFFSRRSVHDIVASMDKSSSKTWRLFLKEAALTNLASCHLSLEEQCGKTSVIDVEGCYNLSTSQYIIRFKEVFDHCSINGMGAESILKYESYFKYAPHGLILATADGMIIEANHQIETFFGVSPEELIGKRSTSVFESFNESSHFIKALKSKGSSEMMTETVNEKGESKYFQVESSFNEVVDMYMVVIRDDTEKMQMKKQMEHSLSLSTLGQLAASIAHEIRNPLTSLKGFTQLLSQQVTEEGDHYLGIINSEINRMESILNEFLALSKPSVKSYQDITVSSIITELIEFMYPQAILQNIEIEFVPSDRLSDCILGDAYEIKKVMMNILKNAIEVMPNGGKIKIIQALEENDRVRISVRDQGCGMTHDQTKKIFLPFYTSKKQGTGLGLPHAIRVVEEHGGCMEVESEINSGTTFHLYFPLYQVDSMKENSTDAQSHAKSDREAISSN
jgi:two-component system, sporulation sensor kinase E